MQQTRYVAIPQTMGSKHTFRIGQQREDGLLQPVLNMTVLNPIDFDAKQLHQNLVSVLNGKDPIHLGQEKSIHYSRVPEDREQKYYALHFRDPAQGVSQMDIMVKPTDGSGDAGLEAMKKLDLSKICRSLDHSAAPQPSGPAPQRNLTH